jgi:two-component system sensor histidine kinase ChiS
MIRIAILAIACGLGGYLAEQYALRATVTEVRLETSEDLGRLRSRVESLLNADVQLVRGLVSYVKVRPDLDQKEFAVVAAELLDSTGGRVRNMALARDLIISHIYPISGNQKALGLDYRNTDAQWLEVERAIKENTVVIAGPIDLVQGGSGIIARFPVFIYPEGWKPAELWGVVSTVIDFDAFIQDVGLPTYNERYDLALVGRDGLGINGDVFWGDPSVLKKDPVLLEVNLVSGTWTIAASPIEGWPMRSELFWLNLAGALILFAIGVYVIYANLRYDMETVRTTALLERARLEAEAAKDAAQRANQAKSEFLAAMSHELRTPLNAILGFSDILFNQYFGPPGAGKYREYANDIHSSAKHLLELVNDVLDISAIEAGKTALETDSVNITDLVNDCVHTVRERASDNGVALTVDMPREMPPLQADRRAVKQVLLNLLSNAVKFTPEGGAVTVRVSVDNGMVEIVVADTGIGIEPDRLPNIMNPFNREAKNPYTSDRGWGLGLSISKSLIDMHGGEIKIESKVSHGTTVTIRLKLDNAEIANGDFIDEDTLAWLEEQG